MSTKNTGGPAFPVPLNPGESYQGHAPCDGMTLRDYFAAKAMQGILGSGLAQPERQQHFDNIAVDTYRMAVAMLKERENT